MIWVKYSAFQARHAVHAVGHFNLFFLDSKCFSSLSSWREMFFCE